MTNQQMIKDLIFRGYSYNELAKDIGGYPELYASVVQGRTHRSGSLIKLRYDLIAPLRDMHTETSHLEEGEHKYGKPRDWAMVIKFISSRGFSYEHISELVGAPNTHIRDIVSKKRTGRYIRAMLRIQGKLLQLYNDVQDWPKVRVKPRGNTRNHNNVTLIRTVGQGWQA